MVGLGGSATTDGGLGALTAVREAGGLGGVELVGACDVDIGFVEAAREFAPQKGATGAQVVELEDRLRSLAERYRRELGVDVLDVPGAGAAGGMGGAIVALGGRLRSGFQVVEEALDLDSVMGQAPSWSPGRVRSTRCRSAGRSWARCWPPPAGSASRRWSWPAGCRRRDGGRRSGAAPMSCP